MKGYIHFEKPHASRASGGIVFICGQCFNGKYSVRLLEALFVQQSITATNLFHQLAFIQTIDFVVSKMYLECSDSHSKMLRRIKSLVNDSRVSILIKESDFCNS